MIKTFDEHGKENGWLMELQKSGHRTLSYLTTVCVGGFKGFHLHKIREANYICIRGKVKVMTYSYFGVWGIGRWTEKVTYLTQGDRLHIPIDTPTGLHNIGDEECWIVNFPNPPYDPQVKEQVEYTELDLQQGVMK